MNHAVAPRSSSSNSNSIAVRKVTAAALFALAGAILLPSCGSDTPPIPKVTGTFSGSTRGTTAPSPERASSSPILASPSA